MAQPSKINSKVKMVAYVDDELSRKGNAIVWYSFPKYNKKPQEEIIQGMLNRLQRYYLFARVKVVQFYDAQADNLIVEYKSTL